MKLTVARGAHQGETYNVIGDAIVGAAEECEITLPDRGVESRHCRLMTNPYPRLVCLGGATVSLNGGSPVEACDLNQDDELAIGDAVFSVKLGQRELSASPKRRSKQRLLLLVVSVVVVLAMLLLVAMVKQEERRRSLPVYAEAFYLLDAIPGVRIYTPLNRETQTVETVPPLSAGRRRFNNVYGSNLRGYESNRDLTLVESYAPDPFAPGFDIRRRSWGQYPPRLGNGRFLPGQQMVLGNYRVESFSFSTDELVNRTPEEFVSTIGVETPLRIDFYVESYEGVPRDAEVSFFSFTARSPDSSFERSSIVPRLLRDALDRNDLLDVPAGMGERRQEAMGVRNDPRGRPMRVFRARQENVNGCLVVLTTVCYAWQSERVYDLMEQFIDNQQMAPVDYGDPAPRIESALRLEAEGDEIFPQLMALRDFESWDRITDKSVLFAAFHHYYAALMQLQRAGQWPYDDDYERIFDKANRIYEYIQDPDGYFRRTFVRIESNMTRYRELSRRAQDSPEGGALRRSIESDILDLYDTTRRGQVPDRFPILDEWFIYSNLRRLQVQN